MSLVPTTVSQSVIIVLAALPLAGIVALLVVRHRRRRRAEALRREDEDFELVFPDGPDDDPVRQTKVGRRLARR
jgi:flagellar biosynthesis/type III secretory pathway M-ring protein FliF/YscJ